MEQWLRDALAEEKYKICVEKEEYTLAQEYARRKDDENNMVIFSKKEHGETKAIITWYYHTDKKFTRQELDEAIDKLIEEQKILAKMDKYFEEKAKEE